MIDQDTGEITGEDYYAQPDPARKIFVRTPYNYNRERATKETGLYCEEPSLAQQHAKDDADINVLVKRFGITGKMPMLERLPMEGDYADVGDFKTAMDAIIAAQDTFMKLPADLRYKFHNDPQEFLEFSSKEENREELRKLGMLKPELAKPEPLEVRLAKDPQDPKPAAGEPPKPPAT